MQQHDCEDSFLALVRGGLWEKEVRLTQFGNIDFSQVLKLAEEQSVVGLVIAGFEHIIDVKAPKEITLQFIGQALHLELRNKAMDLFIAEIVEKMRDADIYTILVKGQGLARCYERPQWRASGDIDFLFSDSNYRKAIELLSPLSSRTNPEGHYSSHQSMSIDSWHVEVHGSLRTCLSGCLDKEIDAVQRYVFQGGNVRTWMNEETIVFLPSPDNDVFFVFTHFIKHFYKEGMTLRQICDWCRLLWTFRGKIDAALLEKRLKSAKLVGEWKGFASLAVEYLGMPVEAMPLYDERYNGKGSKLVEFILQGYSGNKVKDTWGVAKIYPWKTFCYLPSIFLNVNWLKIKERVFGDGN